jgi:hypothetical protein
VDILRVVLEVTAEEQERLKSEQRQREEKDIGHRDNVREVTGNDVFIPCKNLNEDGAPTRDAEIAAEVYNFLTGKGLHVFLSTFTLEQLGTDDYTRAIEAALVTVSQLIAMNHPKPPSTPAAVSRTPQQ